MLQVEEKFCSHDHFQQPPTFHLKKIQGTWIHCYPIKYSKYKTDNHLLFSGIDLGWVGNSLCGIVYKNSTTKYGRYVFLYINV